MKLARILFTVQETAKKISEDKITAYAAQTCYYLLLSFMPFIIALINIIHYFLFFVHIFHDFIDFTILFLYVLFYFSHIVAIFEKYRYISPRFYSSITTTI